MTNENTDNTDEPSKAELHDRVEKLESTVEKLMPSRRDALRMGAAGIAGAAGLGAASQSADAATGSAGTIGSSGSRPDLIADDVGPRSIADDYLFAGEFGGSSPDTRLSNAISAAKPDDTIYLENATYSSNRTISKSIQFKGTRTGATGSKFNGTVTCDNTVSFAGVGFTGKLVLNARRSFIHNCNPFLSTTVEINGDESSYVNNRGGNVVLAGTNIIVDSCTQTTVTDNGTSNVIGDIA